MLLIRTTLLLVSMLGVIVSVEQTNGYYTLQANDSLGDWTIRNGQVWVVYGASWCAPCKILDRNLRTLMPQWDLTVIYVDADVHRHLLVKRNIGTLPTIAMYLDGQQLTTAQQVDADYLKHCYGIIQEHARQRGSQP
ncbi:MAG: thioredoxin family protein [Planctomycetota bacterium]